MIKLLDQTLPASLPCAGSFVGIKIAATLSAYGTSHSFFTVWVQWREDQPTALLAKFEETFFLTAEPDADWEELHEFLTVIGFSSLQADRQLVTQIGFVPTTVYEVLRKQSKQERVTAPLSTPDLKRVYDILFAEEHPALHKPDFSGWYADLSHRIRHGNAAAYLESDGAVAIASHMTEGAAIISGVATLPECRGRGLGTTALNRLTDHLSGRNIFAAAESDTAAFYCKSNFVRIGQIAIVSKTINIKDHNHA